MTEYFALLDTKVGKLQEADTMLHVCQGLLDQGIFLHSHYFLTEYFESVMWLSGTVPAGQMQRPEFNSQ